eukprot:2270630-Rhodomonas_salina.3
MKEKEARKKKKKDEPKAEANEEKHMRNHTREQLRMQARSDSADRVPLGLRGQGRRFVARHDETGPMSMIGISIIGIIIFSSTAAPPAAEHSHDHLHDLDHHDHRRRHHPCCQILDEVLRRAGIISCTLPRTTAGKSDPKACVFWPV